MRVAVIGMGLIGGSFYKASLESGHDAVGAHHCDSSGWETSEIIVVCLPPDAIVPWIREHSPSFAPGTAVVDICGVKQKIMDEMSTVRNRDGWWFVGGHPMAGREVSGYANSTADLFVGASMILTPTADTPPAVIEKLKAYFASVGFHETVITTPGRHDDMIAFTSQLCHVIATAYSRDPRVKDAIGFSAGSYANMTRIATQDSEVWSSLYSTNRSALVAVLDDFAARLREMRDAVAADDTDAMRRIIDEGTKAKRQELLDRQRGDERV